MGAVGGGVYATLSKSMGVLGVIFLISLVVSNYALFVPDIVLGFWADPREPLPADVPTAQLDPFWRRAIVLALAVGFVFPMLAEVFYAFAIVRPLETLHRRALGAVLKSPVSFFDSTPQGRIMNRFSKDVMAMDSELPLTLQDSLRNSLRLMVVVTVAAIVSRGLMVLFVPALVALFYVVSRYQIIARDLQRLESIARSPVVSSILDAQAGLVSVLSFEGWREAFERRLLGALNSHHAPFIALKTMAGWLTLWVNWLVSGLVFATAAVAVVLRGRVPATDLVLGMSTALTLPMFVTYWIESLTQLELQMTSVERIISFTRLEPEEVVKQRPSPPADWPTRGGIGVKDATMAYREDLPNVLNGASFQIEAGEKVGVVGRTGAGKSSLFRVLLRVNECDEGTSMEIDGVDLRAMALKDVRSAIFLIPQDATLFKGTIRYNVDPTGYAKSDEEIWQALDTAGLSETVKGFAGDAQLDFLVEDGGSNLSAGQRQLFCIVRALIRKPKILLVDEATASVDAETDSRIQTVMRSEFKDATVLTIAHRLETIADSDKFLVVEDGKVVETPDFDAAKLRLGLQ